MLARPSSESRLREHSSPNLNLRAPVPVDTVYGRGVGALVPLMFRGGGSELTSELHQAEKGAVHRCTSPQLGYQRTCQPLLPGGSNGRGPA
jgi:hypothetical protein